MVSQSSFEESTQLWSRMAFWLEGGVPGFDRPKALDEKISATGPDVVMDLLFTNPSAEAAAQEILASFRSFLRRLLENGARDEPYYGRIDATGTRLYSFFILFDGDGEDQIFFKAPGDAEALMGMLRYATAQQAAFPEVRSTILQARVQRFDFGEINDDGQVFYGEPGTFFDWHAQRETNFDDYGMMSLDASALLWAAKLAVDPVYWPK